MRVAIIICCLPLCFQVANAQQARADTVWVVDNLGSIEFNGSRTGYTISYPDHQRLRFMLTFLKEDRKLLLDQNRQLQLEQVLSDSIANSLRKIITANETQSRQYQQAYQQVQLKARQLADSLSRCSREWEQSVYHQRRGTHRAFAKGVLIGVAIPIVLWMAKP